MKRQTAICSGLLILVGLASRRFGLTLREMMDEADISRRQVFNQIRALEAMGVQIHRQREPIRGTWKTLYRLAGIRGLRFDIRRQAQ